MQNSQKLKENEWGYIGNALRCNNMGFHALSF